MIQWDINGMLPSGVIKHGWLENPRAEWRFLARKITDRWSIFQHAMFDDWKVNHTVHSKCNYIIKLLGIRNPPCIEDGKNPWHQDAWGESQRFHLSLIAQGFLELDRYLEDRNLRT